MKVHRSYLAVIKKLTAADLVVGMAHITGGGITENLPRILPKTISAIVETGAWTPPPIFTHLQQLGSVDQEEMLRTFNMGIGLIVVVPADKFRRAKSNAHVEGAQHFFLVHAAQLLQMSKDRRRSPGAVSTIAEMVLGRMPRQVFRDAPSVDVGHPHYEIGGGELLDHSKVAAMHLHQRGSGLILQVIHILVGGVAGNFKEQLARQGIAIGMQAG